MFKKAALKDGTEGHRYSWGLKRKRKPEVNARLSQCAETTTLGVVRGKYILFGIVNGRTMIGLHAGRRSLYVEKRRTRKPLWNFNAS